MNTAENQEKRSGKELVLDYIQSVINEGKLERIDLLFGEEIRPKVKNVTGMLRVAFPDMNEVIETIISEGDTVAARWTFSGTHSGPFLEIPATGKRVSFSGLSMYYVKDGRIEDDIAVLDLLRAAIQLGATLVPPAAENQEAKSAS